METKHTPGPWEIRDLSDKIASPYFRIAGGNYYADGDAMGFEITGIMREADARLIAAAPDLLAELKTMVQRWEGDCSNAQDHAILQTARAAIAKATGTQKEAA